MWAAIVGSIAFIYIAIFSLLKTSARGEETSRKHRADLLAEKEKNSSIEKIEGTEIKDEKQDID